MEINGRNILKWTGLLLAVSGACDLAEALMMLVMGIASGQLLIIAPAVASQFVFAVVCLMTGITGFKYCGDKSRAKLCLMWGLVNLLITVLLVLGNLILSRTASDGGISWAVMFQVMIPVLYVMGAFLSKGDKTSGSAGDEK